MSAEQMRALPIVIAEKRSSQRAGSGEDGQSHKAPELVDLLLGLDTQTLADNIRDWLF